MKSKYMYLIGRVYALLLIINIIDLIYCRNFLKAQRRHIDAFRSHDDRHFGSALGSQPGKWTRVYRRV